MAYKWYALQTLSGHEQKVAHAIESLVEQDSMSGKVGRVIVPEKEVTQVKKGKKVKSKRKFFPSYVLIEMEMDSEARHYLSTISGVLNFVGSKGPEPLKEKDVNRILGEAEAETEQETREFPFDVGDSVKIKDGPFKDFDGVVEEVHPERGKIKVMVSVFGRATPVEVDFMQVGSV